jgi:hypothetical protein
VPVFHRQSELLRFEVKLREKRVWSGVSSQKRNILGCRALAEANADLAATRRIAKKSLLLRQRALDFLAKGRARVRLGELLVHFALGDVRVDILPQAKQLADTNVGQITRFEGPSAELFSFSVADRRQARCR